MLGPTCIFWANLTPFLLKHNAELRDADHSARRKMSGVERALQKKAQLRSTEEQEIARIRQKYTQTKRREVEQIRAKIAEEEKQKFQELEEEERRVNSFGDGLA